MSNPDASFPGAKKPLWKVAEALLIREGGVRAIYGEFRQCGRIVLRPSRRNDYPEDESEPVRCQSPRHVVAVCVPDDHCGPLSWSSITVAMSAARSWSVIASSGPPDLARLGT